jgi:hypothetical protein
MILTFPKSYGIVESLQRIAVISGGFWFFRAYTAFCDPEVIMRYLPYILLVTLALSLISFLHARVIHIPADSSTIQGGIYGAVDGDTVIVHPGIYYEHQIDFLGKAITVTGIDPEDSAVVAATVVDADSLGRVFVFFSGEDSSSILAGLTVTGGYISYDQGGAGIWCLNTSPTIMNNIVTGNHATDAGGIDCHWYASPKISGNIITGNTADEGGGGIRCYLYCSPRIINYIIVRNDAFIGGGGIRCYYSSPTISSNTFSDNSAYWGAAIYCFNGGIPPYPIVSNNTVSENSAHSGGGIYCNFSSPLILNNTITGNSANFGGGITSYRYASAVVTNTILWRNDAPTGQEIYVGDLEDPSMLTVRYSDVDGGEASVYVESGSALNWGDGMIDADPVFMSFRGFEYLLRRGSPCIDGGDPGIEDGIDWPAFYNNNPRSDMGAYGGPGNTGWLR